MRLFFALVFTALLIKIIYNTWHVKAGHGEAKTSCSVKTAFIINGLLSFVMIWSYLINLVSESMSKSSGPKLLLDLHYYIVTGKWYLVYMTLDILASIAVMFLIYSLSG